MRAVAITKALTAASANTVAHAQSLAGAGYLTLTATPIVLDSGRQIIITSAGDDSGLTWTIVGLDDAGAGLKDSFAGANGIATSNLTNIKTVTSIYGSAATASTVTAGTNTVGSSSWKMFSDTIATPQMDIYMQLVSGSGTATFEYTPDPFEMPIGVQSATALGPNTPSPVALAHPDLQTLSASKEGSVNWTIHGWRLTINSGTGVWKCTARQSGLASP